MRILIFIILSSILSVKSIACSCIGERTVKQEIARADIIVQGKVLKVDRFSVFDNSPGLRKPFEFAFHKVMVSISVCYKGRLQSDTIEIVTSASSGDCGYIFEKGKDYIIYAYYLNRYYTTGSKVPRYLSTDICSRTRILDYEEIDELQRYIRLKRKYK